MVNMSKKDIIIDELKQIPEKFLDEILDYIKFLKEKLIKQKMETAIMSESSLKKDWLRPEEDEAWLDL